MTPAERDRAIAEDLLELAAKLTEGLIGLNQATFARDEAMVDATAFRLLHIGEKAHRFTPALRARRPEIDWLKVIAMRNVLAHEYEPILTSTLWMVATEHVPELVRALEAELEVS